MGLKKQLSQRQLAVLDDLFNSDLEEQAVLNKYKVRRSTYDRWLEDMLFAERFKQYTNGLKRRSELLMAKYSCLAAAKLVELTASGKEETARKACLDIISLPGSPAQRVKQSAELQAVNPSVPEQVRQLPPETVGRLLAVLAEAKRRLARTD